MADYFKDNEPNINFYLLLLVLTLILYVSVTVYEFKQDNKESEKILAEDILDCYYINNGSLNHLKLNNQANQTCEEIGLYSIEDFWDNVIINFTQSERKVSK